MLPVLFGCNNNPSGTAGKTNIAPEPQARNIDGAAIFKNNCANCHKCDMDYTGPSIKGSLERWGNKQDLVDFVQNSELFLSNNYVKELKKKYESKYIHQFKSLAANEIMATIYSCDMYQQ